MPDSVGNVWYFIVIKSVMCWWYSKQWRWTVWAARDVGNEWTAMESLWDSPHWCCAGFVCSTL